MPTFWEDILNVMKCVDIWHQAKEGLGGLYSKISTNILEAKSTILEKESSFLLLSNFIEFSTPYVVIFLK